MTRDVYDYDDDGGGLTTDLDLPDDDYDKERSGATRLKIAKYGCAGRRGLRLRLLQVNAGYSTDDYEDDAFDEHDGARQTRRLGNATRRCWPVGRLKLAGRLAGWSYVYSLFVQATATTHQLQLRLQHSGDHGNRAETEHRQEHELLV
ncbi:hypothetical protein RRG08_041687 [Elysia crispata]|uniref:Uncharacterized protein n=1 Tax=Elysia crispata TaxID=231223 RepID=A0AAE0ZT82_9GAST|nr:hypothetical protein RRG08_041687 [Elysia crispata]